MSEADHLDGSPDMRRLERISALADGRLEAEEFAQAVEAAVHDPEARAVWHAYHLLGDVLRSGEMAAQGAGNGFAARFAARLAREAPLEPAGGVAAVAARETAGTAPAHRNFESFERLPQREPAANSPVFRWKMVAGLAMGVAVGAVGWNLFDTGFAPAAGRLAQFAGTGSASSASDARVQQRALASQEAAAGAAAPVLVRHPASPPMLRDPRLDELLAAHEQAGGVSALQMPAGFLRNATFEGRGR